MNRSRTFVRATGLALLISAAAGLPAWAASHQGGHGAHGDHGKPMAQAATGDMTDGEVRKVDKENRKITLRHGEIKSLEMPSMTMVFQVKDPAMLDTIKPGDKVVFKAEKANGALVVTEIRAAK